MGRSASSIRSEKKKLRERIWELMSKRDIAAPPFPVKGRIPNFKGSERAAGNLDLMPEYRSAKVVLTAPDYVLFHARTKCLSDGKVVLMATPKLREGYLLLQPEKIKNIRSASTISGAFRIGKRMPAPVPVDFVIQSCLAVDKRGHRLGKGGGYGDKEIASARRLNPDTRVAVLCSSRQVVDSVPFEESDQLVDFIVTEATVLIVER